MAFGGDSHGHLFSYLASANRHCLHQPRLSTNTFSNSTAVVDSNSMVTWAAIVGPQHCGCTHCSRWHRTVVWNSLSKISNLSHTEGSPRQRLEVFMNADKLYH